MRWERTQAGRYRRYMYLRYMYFGNCNQREPGEPLVLYTLKEPEPEPEKSRIGP